MLGTRKNFVIIKAFAILGNGAERKLSVVRVWLLVGFAAAGPAFPDVNSVPPAAATTGIADGQHSGKSRESTCPRTIERTWHSLVASKKPRPRPPATRHQSARHQTRPAGDSEGRTMTRIT